MLHLNDGSIEIFHTPTQHRMEMEFRTFAQQIQTGDLAACYTVMEHSLNVVRAQTQARQFAGIHFPADQNEITGGNNMGLFDFLKDKGRGRAEEAPAVEAAFPAVLGAPTKGTFVTMAQIPDEMFSTGVLGTCCGIDPEEGKVYAPASGKISQLTDTRHAVGLEAGGVEILIHVGVDTVDMNGEGFANMVKLGQNVNKGDLLLTMDLEKIRAAGHPTTVIMAVTNTDDLSLVEDAAFGSAWRRCAETQ